MTPMRSVADIYAAARAAGRQPVSFEIFPPKGDLTLEAAHEVAAELADLLLTRATGMALEPLEVPGVAELRAQRLSGVQLP